MPSGDPGPHGRQHRQEPGHAAEPLVLHRRTISPSRHSESCLGRLGYEGCVGIGRMSTYADVSLRRDRLRRPWPRTTWNAVRIRASGPIPRIPPTPAAAPRPSPRWLATPVAWTRDLAAAAGCGRRARSAPPGAPTVLLDAYDDVQPTGGYDLNLAAVRAHRARRPPARVVPRTTRPAIMTHLAVLRAYAGRPPVGVTLFVEGEYVGSPCSPGRLDEHRERRPATSS